MFQCKRWLIAIVTAPILAACVSCLPTVHPLSDEKTSKIDERLIGRWYANDDKETVYTVSRSRDTRNGLECAVREKQKDAGMSPLFATSLKSKAYLSVFDPEASAKKEPAWAIYQYEVLDKDTVQVRCMDFDVIRRAIEKKQIEGRIIKNKDKDPHITAPTEAIRRYLEAHAGECYSRKPDYTLTFKRLKP
jgi:hypothetical protein